MSVNEFPGVFPPPPPKALLKNPSDIERRHCCGASFFDWSRLISNAFIPLLIGVVTIVITIQQQKVAQENRNKDIIIAVEQRKQDLEIARLRREEDKEASRLQRKEDMEMAREQREQDRNTSKLQREVDMQIAKDKRTQDDELADKQRKLASEQRQHEVAVAHAQRATELALEDDRQKENILIGYQRDLATIFLQYGTNLTGRSNPARFAIQMKTRTALRQLNPARRTIVIRSLYDANILTLPFDDYQGSFLAYANLSYVEFSESRDSTSGELTFTYERFFAPGADLRNASFRNVFMADYRLVSDKANLYGVDWANSELRNLEFFKTSMIGATFDSANLIDVRFDKVQLDQVSFRHVHVFVRCSFKQSSLKRSDWSGGNFEGVLVQETSMEESDLSKSRFINARFIELNMDYVNLSGAHFHSVVFNKVNMTMCALNNITANGITFAEVNLTGCTGFNMSEWSDVSITSTILPDGTFKA